MEITSQIRKFKTKWKRLGVVKGGALITNKSGKVKFAVYVDHIDEDESFFYIVNNAEELALLHFSEELKAEAWNPVQFAESEFFRSGFSIAFQPTLDYAFFGSGLDSRFLLGRENCMVKSLGELDEAFVYGKNRELLERILSVILTGRNFSTISKAIAAAEDTEQMAVVEYNQQTAVCTATGRLYDYPELAEIHLLETIFQERPIPLAVEETMMQQLKTFLPDSIEVKLGVIDTEQNPDYELPQLTLTVATPLVVTFHPISREFFSISLEEMQQAVATFCLKKQIRPTKIQTSGIFARYIQNAVESFATALSCEFVVEEELPVLDHLADLNEEWDDDDE